MEKRNSNLQSSGFQTRTISMQTLCYKEKVYHLNNEEDEVCLMNILLKDHVIIPMIKNRDGLWSVLFRINPNVIPECLRMTPKFNYTVSDIETTLSNLKLMLCFGELREPK